MTRLARLALISVTLIFTACPDDDAPPASEKARPGTPVSTTPDQGQPTPLADAGTPGAASPMVDAGTAAQQDADGGTAATSPPGTPLYATFHTSLGDIVIRLLPEHAPKTVQNFVELATGKKKWIDPRTRKETTARLYDGTIFHRVIPDFMIQGGDPLGVGMGGPGYEFEDERQSLRFDKPGLLAMANRGPNTNGSQFFITVSQPSHLNGRHTIFGEVVEGYDVVERISEVPTGERNKPQKDVVLRRVVISEKKP